MTIHSQTENTVGYSRPRRIQLPRQCKNASSPAEAKSPPYPNSSRSSSKRKSDDDNTVHHAENITPKAARRKREHDAKAIVSSVSMQVSAVPSSGLQSTPHKIRTGRSGVVHSYGSSEARRDEVAKKNAREIAEKYAYLNVGEVLRMAGPTSDNDMGTAAAIESIANTLESLLAGKDLPHSSKLSAATLVPFVNEINEWTRVGPSVSKEKLLYDYFSGFVLFVAHCLKSMAVCSELNVARLVLPSLKADFKPIDCNDDRRVDLALHIRDIDTSVDRVDSNVYADMFGIMEAKANIGDQDEALGQLILYSSNMYMTQSDRRFLWGMTVCADAVYTAVMLNDSVLVSPVVKISEEAGRRELVSLLVNWSTCSVDKLGYDPTMRRVTHEKANRASGVGMGDFNSIDIDAIRYEIDCYDDKTGKTQTYITRRTIMSADDIFGRHTRCFVAVPARGYGEAAAEKELQEVVIKDAWPPSENPVFNDPRSEIEFLRIIRDTYEKSPPKDFIYPKLIVGGHVRLDSNNRLDSVDTTDAIFKLLGVERADLPPDVDKSPTWQNQQFRAHRRIVMSPVGHSIKTVENEEELIIVLAEAMRFHSSLVKDCNILHRDISTNNILVVRDNGDGSGTPRGLLIDFDFAIKVDNKERKARAERSGTLPYMSIANLLNLDCERTALDDWESLLYIVCWLATIGINSKDRDAIDLTTHRPIFQWNNGLSKDIAVTKRLQMDSFNSFRDVIVKHFEEKYILLPELAAGLYDAIFAYSKCSGANISQPRQISHRFRQRIVGSGYSQKLPEEPVEMNDPLVTRNEYVDEIVGNLQQEMNSFDELARKNPSESQENCE